MNVLRMFLSETIIYLTGANSWEKKWKISNSSCKLITKYLIILLPLATVKKNPKINLKDSLSHYGFSASIFRLNSYLGSYSQEKDNESILSLVNCCSTVSPNGKIRLEVNFDLDVTKACLIEL